MKKLWHRLFYLGANSFAWVLVRLFIRVRVTGRKNLPTSGPCLIICNHISHFDPPVLAGVIWRKVAWVVAKDMHAHPVGEFYFKSIEAICVDREKSDRKAAREMLRRLQQGEPVGLFPEAGIRSGDRSILGGQPVDQAVGGFAQLAKVPVIPTLILGTDKLYCRSAWAWRTTVDVAFGVAIDPTGLSREEISKRTGDSMCGVAQALRLAYRLTDQDFPMTAQERWALEIAKKGSH